MQGTSHVVERIAAVGRRTLALTPDMSATIGYALREMHNAALRLGQRDVQRARHPQRKAMRYLNETVLLLRESLDNLAKAQTPSAFAEAMQQLLGLSEQQSQLNQASEQAMGQMPSPALQRQIARLSAQQQGLMQALDEIARSLRGHRGAQQRVRAIQDEMRDVLADLQRDDSPSARGKIRSASTSACSMPAALSTAAALMKNGAVLRPTTSPTLAQPPCP